MQSSKMKVTVTYKDKTVKEITCNLIKIVKTTYYLLNTQDEVLFAFDFVKDAVDNVLSIALA